MTTFIELTEHDCQAPDGIGRTLHVRGDRIDWIADVDAPDSNPYTKVCAGNELHVVETPMEVLEKIRSLIQPLESIE